MTETPRPPPGPPLPGLAMIAQMGPRNLFYPAAQEVLPGARSFLNLPYALIPGFRMLRLDLHVPVKAPGPIPVVVYASGGGFMLVLKHHGPWKFLLEQGIAVASIEYRPSGEARYPAALHDVKAAVRWVRGAASSYGLDPDKVAGWGSSAGGYLMAMAGTTNGMKEFEGQVGDDLQQSSRLCSVIDHYGPTDFIALAEDTNHIPGVVEAVGTETSPDTRFLGFRPQSRPEETARASPMSYVTSDTVPFLIMHGDADTRVGIGQSVRLHKSLQAAGADVEFATVPGANHAGPEFDGPDAQARALAFLKRTLNLPH